MQEASFALESVTGECLCVMSAKDPVSLSLSERPSLTVVWFLQSPSKPTPLTVLRMPTRLTEKTHNRNHL